VGTAVEVNVQLLIESDAISGSMTTPGGAKAPFTGWLGLITAVERLRGGLPDPDHEPPENHD
jgi:hypothetical protein